MEQSGVMLGRCERDSRERPRRDEHLALGEEQGHPAACPGLTYDLLRE
jgi:hypothetical protein